MQKNFDGIWLSAKSLGHDPACPYGETKLREMIHSGEAEQKGLGVWAGSYFRFNREKVLKFFGVELKQDA